MVYRSQNKQSFLVDATTSLIFLGLYAKSIMGALPAGIPFYYEMCGDGLFSRSFATERKDFSWAVLDYINYLADDERF